MQAQGLLQSDALLFINSIANRQADIGDGVDEEQGIALEQALCPVSYTHLDVYKRQAQGYFAQPV